MTRPPDPKSKTSKISFDGRNDGECLKLFKFKDLVRRDNTTYLDVFLPIIESRVQADNPQLKFVQNGENLRLNKTIPKPGTTIPGARIYEVKVVCEFCGERHTAQVVCASPSEEP